MNTYLTKAETKILLIENIDPLAKTILNEEGYSQVESLKSALSEAELRDKIRGVHMLGIRSKTQITKAVLESADQLLSLGCFCIGTNQVDLDAAELRGIPVFNAPFSNTRSVAEMVLAEIIMLARQLGDRSQEVHNGKWRKVAASCYEVRGKTLGIVGYGHIGSQVGVLAELLGLSVLYHDIAAKLPLGNNQSCSSLKELLERSEFVTLHVPATPQTNNLIGAAQLACMKPKSYLLNASRNSVVDLGSLVAALKTGHLAGAAVDVFPGEPDANSDQFQCELQGLPNVILTPHIGGSTKEAQTNIAREVLASLSKYLRHGSTTGAVNFPQVESPQVKNTYRILNIHHNVPGVLKNINQIVSDMDANIHSQILSTNPKIGYLVMDLDQDVSTQVMEAIMKLQTSIRTRQVPAF